jgi:hypothetical protein
MEHEQAQSLPRPSHTALARMALPTFRASPKRILPISCSSSRGINASSRPDVSASSSSDACPAAVRVRQACPWIGSDVWIWKANDCCARPCLRIGWGQAFTNSYLMRSACAYHRRKPGSGNITRTRKPALTYTIDRDKQHGGALHVCTNLLTLSLELMHGRSS